MIKLEYQFFHEEPGYIEEGKLGSILIDTRFPSKIWIILREGEIMCTEDFIEELSDILKEVKGTPPYTLEDFTSKEVMDLLIRYYSWESLDMNAHLTVEGRTVDISSIDIKDVFKTNIPRDMEIKGISNFKNLIYLNLNLS